MFYTTCFTFCSNTILCTLSSSCKETLVCAISTQFLSLATEKIYFNNTEGFSDVSASVIHRTSAPIKFILWYCSLLISVTHNREKSNMIIAF
jgi:hypothetical protein